MGIRRPGTTATGAVAVMALLFGGLPVGYFLVAYGCGRQEERFGVTLADEPVLGAGIAGAVVVDTYQECDDDGPAVAAGRAYRYDGDREGVLRHYRDAAQAEGWRHRAGDCFTQRIDGALASPMPEGPADGSFAVETAAAADSSEAWC
ncbi:hypothetical protein QBA75_13410 [Streptomyces stelliscabiei]